MRKILYSLLVLSCSYSFAETSCEYIYEHFRAKKFSAQDLLNCKYNDSSRSEYDKNKAYTIIDAFSLCKNADLQDKLKGTVAYNCQNAIKACKAANVPTASPCDSDPKVIFCSCDYYDTQDYITPPKNDVLK